MFNQNRGGTDIPSLLMKATQLQQGGQFLKAAEIFEDIISHFKRVSMPEKDIARFIGNLAACYWKGGKLDKALEIYQEAKTLRKKYNEIGPYALALMNMGEIYGNKEQYAKALGIEKGSDDWFTFSDLAAACAGRLPQDIASNNELLQALPLIFRTARTTKMNEKELRGFIEAIKKELP